MKAIWKRPKSELTEEATNEFYTHLTHDHNPPLKTIPMSVEGVVEFKALLAQTGYRPDDAQQEVRAAPLRTQRLYRCRLRPAIAGVPAL